MGIGGFFYGINLFLLVKNAQIDSSFIRTSEANPSFFKCK